MRALKNHISRVNLFKIALFSLSNMLQAESPKVTGELFVTQNNRRYWTATEQMYGGWGHHLRGIMRDKKDQLWMTIDRGPTINKNLYLDYYKYNGQNWRYITSQTQLSGIQQNVASIMLSGATIASYGISITTRYVEECYLHVSNLAKACNAIYVGGAPLVVARNSNYIGAAVAPDGLGRIVWWSTVGENGGSGKFNYIYNFGGGWNGPVSNYIGGYNSLEYITGNLGADFKFVGTGLLINGAYPASTYQGGIISMQLGQASQLALLWPDSPSYNAGFRVKSGQDIFVDPVTKAVHIIAATSGSELAYFYSPTNNIPAAGLTWKKMFPLGVLGRFQFDSQNLNLITGSLSNTEVKVRSVASADLGNAIDWDKASEQTVSSQISLGVPSAIYVESAQYQSLSAKEMNFAIVGGSKVADAYVAHFSAKALTVSKKSAGGILCGLETYNIYNGWSRGVTCGGLSPSVACPTGYDSVKTVTNGGVNTIYSCASTQLDAVPTSGMLCGLSAYTVLNNGIQNFSTCNSLSPFYSCPTGYKKFSVVQNGGYDILYSCAAPSTGNNLPGGLCGLSSNNLLHGPAVMSQCGDKTPTSCPSEGYSLKQASLNSGWDQLSTCSTK